jgi:hypothetical protein
MLVDVKDKIEYKYNLHPDRLRIVFAGKLLLDHYTVNDYNLYREGWPVLLIR